MPFPLPDELIGLTFNQLDIPSLLRCTQVCKLFQSIILGNAQLCYKIELFASCMEDDERSSMDIATRLNILREYNQAWNDMKWSSSGTIPMTNGQCWEFSGGVLAQATPEHEISFVRLPCKLKRIEEKRWTAPFDFRIRDFTMDISQNLVVLIELTGTAPAMPCKLHLRTLSGGPHPDAAVAQITHEVVGLNTDFSFLIQICGDHLAVLYYDQVHTSPPSSFFVWNWKTGHQEVYIHTSCFRSFAFMTEDLILAAILKTDATPTLQVLSIGALANPVNSVEDLPYVCEFHYPELDGTVEYFLIRSDPTPTWRPPAGSEVPFHVSRKHLIFTISMHVLVAETRQSTVLFVPLSRLLSTVEFSRNSPRQSFVWYSWGPSATRMICREPSETWVCYTYGMKYIQGLRWKDGHMARVYDFNPHAAKKHFKTTIDSSIPWKKLAKESIPGSRCDAFDEKVSTTLPGRVCDVTLAHSDKGWEAAMIGEDHILMVHPNSSTYGYMAL